MENRSIGIVLLSAGILFACLPSTAKGNVQPKGPEEDGTKPALVKIAGEGTMDSHAFQYLTELSDEIGARVTGSPEDQKAIHWGVEKMKAIGLKNVRAENIRCGRAGRVERPTPNWLRRCTTHCLSTPWVGRAPLLRAVRKERW